jgi:hypothetical protein
MPHTSRTFRIFVSSTFSDLVAERNALRAAPLASVGRTSHAA